MFLPHYVLLLRHDVGHVVFGSFSACILFMTNLVFYRFICPVTVYIVGILFISLLALTCHLCYSRFKQLFLYHLLFFCHILLKSKFVMLLRN